MKRFPAAIGAAAGLLLACTDTSGPETPERPLYYLKAPTNSGDRQQDTVLATLGLPFRVLVRRGDAPASGIPVQWEIPDGTGGTSFATRSVTGNDGIATSPFRLTLGSISGTYTVRARVDGVFVPSPIEIFTDVRCGEGVCFTATALPGQPKNLRYISGDGQIGTGGTTLVADYVVQSTDLYGNGSPGAVINWAVTAGGGTITPTQNLTSGPYGLAAARHSLGADEEIQRVQATGAGLAGPVTFTSRGYSPLPVASVTVVPESLAVQVDRTALLLVELRDAGGRLIIQRPVTWTSRDPAVATVDSTGRARGTSPGATTVIAESEGVSDSAAITVTAGPPPVIFASIVAGAFHTCGLRSDGAAFCWGDNLYGQLGDASTVSRSTPVPVAGGHSFAALVSGAAHTCGLKSDGTAYCWGYNEDGELGNGQTSSSAIPVLVSGGHTFASLGTGGYSTCGVTNAGKAYCWGWNLYGQLGDGRSSSAAIPVAVSGSLTFAAMATGFGTHTCAVTTTGAAYCWGRNLEYQLGTTSPETSNTPVAVGGSLSFSALRVGAYASCGITTDAVTQCWGDNHWGELGDGFSGFRRAAPGPVTGSADIATITLGGGHGCQISSSGAATCWGLNGDGQLGNGSTAEAPTPVAVFGAYTFRVVAAGGYHTCALTDTGVAYCWGFNGSGQLGDATTASSALPVRVVSGP